MWDGGGGEGHDAKVNLRNTNEETLCSFVVEGEVALCSDCDMKSLFRVIMRRVVYYADVWV